MALRAHSPTTPSERFNVRPAFDEVTKRTPERTLLEPMKSRAGRGSSGRISVRHRGGGHKRQYRRIDFRREKTGIPAKVAAIEYDPNRSARLALLHYVDGEKRYILAPVGLQVGATVVSGPDVEPAVGNAMPLGRVPAGVLVHNVELEPGRGAQIARSAGLSVQVLSKEERFANVRMPSGEVRMLDLRCMATIGQVGNIEHDSLSIGKAGRKRWMGIRPTVRGVAMNPVDHPMGGGEGRSKGGFPAVTPWGVPTKGKKTRGRRKPSGRFIVKRRE